MRKLAFLNLLIVLVLVLAACGPTATEAPPEPTEPPPEPTEDVGEAIVAEEATATPVEVEVSMYSQSPMLDGMDLPPLEERLPKERTSWSSRWWTRSASTVGPGTTWTMIPARTR
jgi:hypothetical protein